MEERMRRWFVKKRVLHSTLRKPQARSNCDIRIQRISEPLAMNRSTRPHSQPTIGIITALPKEFSAVEIMLEHPVPWSAEGKGAGRRYVLGEIPSFDSGTHGVALALLADVGTNNAAVRANKLLEHFPSVRHIIMCGIAGGISEQEDIRLGDIVVSDMNGVVNYDFIKQTPESIEERYPPRPGLIHCLWRRSGKAEWGQALA